MKTIKEILRKSKGLFLKTLGGNEAISISILQGIYGIGVHNTLYWSTLKKKMAAFLDQLHFVTAKANTPEIILNANKVSAYVVSNNESNILTAANIIKKKIYCSIVVNKQNQHGHHPLNNFQHLKEIYLNQFIYL